MLNKRIKLTNKLWFAQNGLCFYCGKIMWRPPLPPNWRDCAATKDHVFPRSRSGRGLFHNTVLAHQKCNNLKGSRKPTDDEIERTKRLYESFGEKAFITLEELMGWQ